MPTPDEIMGQAQRAKEVAEMIKGGKPLDMGADGKLVMQPGEKVYVEVPPVGGFA
ncbi:MAG: hypothetical protein HUK22_04840 [Thermoguttaceae bacterium]|nr:hypothetical protein [Thermoguttaceae bacterium]